MIKVFSFHPEFFNNNGDQGNLEALAHFTKTSVEFKPLAEAEFVLFGDASRAAMRHFAAELEAMVPQLEYRLAEQLPTLLVGSCFEHFSNRINGLPTPLHGDRVSEFRTATSDGLEVRGYRNSTLTSPDLFVQGAFVATTLFGPVLAKNPGLLQRVADALKLKVEISESEQQWIGKI